MLNEITESKFYLENLIDSSVDSFCYPYGSFNEKIINEVKKIINLHLQLNDLDTMKVFITNISYLELIWEKNVKF